MGNARLILIFCFLLLIESARPQSPGQPDSLLIALQKSETDTGKLTIQTKVIAWFYSHSNIDAAIAHVKDGLALAKKTGNKKREADFIQWQGIIYINKSFYDLALESFQASITIYESLDYKKGVATGLNNIGAIYFDDLDNIPKALEFYLQGLKVKNEMGDTKGVGINYSNIGNCYIEMKEYDKALDYLLKAKKVYEGNGDKEGLARTYNYFGHYYTIQKNYQEALKFRLLALQLSQDIHFRMGESSSNTGLARIYRERKEYDKAAEFFQKARDINLAIDYKLGNLYNYEGLVKTYAAQKKYDSAFHYQEAYDDIKDSMKKSQSDNRIAEMQVKFETEKKEREIDRLNTATINNELLLAKRKNQVLYLLGSILILLTGMLVFYFRYRQAQYKKIAGKELEMKTLEQKQQKELLHAIVNTQEAERNKLAINLHDGLGQMLTAAKINLLLCLEEAPAQDDKEILSGNINRSIEMVHKALVESKNIASDLLPVNIAERGLLSGLKDICENNNASNPQFKINFYASGVPDSLPQMVEINVFRICQEMITNAIKHSGASLADLQLFYRDETLIIQMEDNGKGFIPSQEGREDKKGLGMKSIETRVKLLSAEINIDSSPGNGTTFTIHVPLQKSA